MPSVRQWLDWRLTNVLPRWGGTLDQDATFMDDLRFILVVESNYHEEKEAKTAIRNEINKRIGRK